MGDRAHGEGVRLRHHGLIEQANDAWRQDRPAQVDAVGDDAIDFVVDKGSDGNIEREIRLCLHVSLAARLPVGERLFRARAEDDADASPCHFVQGLRAVAVAHHHRLHGGIVGLAELDARGGVTGLRQRRQQHFDVARDQRVQRGLACHLHELDLRAPSLDQRARQICIEAADFTTHIQLAKRRFVEQDADPHCACAHDLRDGAFARQRVNRDGGRLRDERRRDKRRSGILRRERKLRGEKCARQEAHRHQGFAYSHS